MKPPIRKHHPPPPPPKKQRRIPEPFIGFTPDGEPRPRPPGFRSRQGAEGFVVPFIDHPW